MNEKQIGGNKRRKALSAILAIAMVLTMLLSGTLAYFYRSTATNVFKDVRTVKKVVAHDDYDAKTGNKDLYLENLGTSRVFVRVKLTEDFYLNQKTLTTATYTPDDADIYKPVDTDGNALTGDNIDWAHKTDATTDTAYGGHVHKVTGTSADEAEGDDAVFHKTYFKWTMGGTGYDANPDNDKSTKQFLSAADPLYGKAEGDDGYQEGVYMKGERTVDGAEVKDVAHDDYGKGVANPTTPDADAGVTTYVKETASCAGVITMADYKAIDDTSTTEINESRAFSGWVMDEDGWCYWSQPVEGGKATGLLLDKVETLKKLAYQDYNYQYHIHVAFESVDDADCGLWNPSSAQSTDMEGNPVTTDDASADAWAMLKLFEIGKSSTGSVEEEVSDVPTVAELDANIAAANRVGADKVAALFEKAKSSLANRAYQSEAIELNKTAKAALQKYNNNKDLMKEVLVNYDGSTDTKGTIKDAKLAQYLVTTYGDGTTLTYGQALGVDAVNTSNDFWTYKGIASFEGLNYSRFPSLRRIIMSNNQEGNLTIDKINAIDADLKANMIELTLNQCFVAGVVNLQGFNKLRILDLSGSPDISEVRSLPKGLGFLNLGLTAITTLDLTGVSESLEVLRLDGTKLTSISGLNHLPQLKFFSFTGYYHDGVIAGTSTQAWKPFLGASPMTEIDLTGSPRLTCLSLHKNQNIETVKLPASQEAFKTIRYLDACCISSEHFNITPMSVSPTVDIKYCTALTSFDMSSTGYYADRGYAGWNIDVTGCKSLGANAFYKKGVANPYTNLKGTEDFYNDDNNFAKEPVVWDVTPTAK